MASRDGHIKVEGLREFQREVRRAADRDLPKRLGQANKEIGALVISRLSPAPRDTRGGYRPRAAFRP